LVQKGALRKLCDVPLSARRDERHGGLHEHTWTDKRRRWNVEDVDQPGAHRLHELFHVGANAASPSTPASGTSETTNLSFPDLVRGSESRCSTSIRSSLPSQVRA